MGNLCGINLFSINWVNISNELFSCVFGSCIGFLVLAVEPIRASRIIYMDIDPNFFIKLFLLLVIPFPVFCLLMVVIYKAIGSEKRDKDKE